MGKRDPSPPVINLVVINTNFNNSGSVFLLRIFHLHRHAFKGVLNQDLSPLSSLESCTLRDAVGYLSFILLKVY